VSHSSKARAALGWSPKTGFEDMIREMLEHDIAALGIKADQYLRARSTNVA